MRKISISGVFVAFIISQIPKVHWPKHRYLPACSRIRRRRSASSASCCSCNRFCRSSSSTRFFSANLARALASAISSISGLRAQWQRRSAKVGDREREGRGGGERRNKSTRLSHSFQVHANVRCDWIGGQLTRPLPTWRRNLFCDRPIGRRRTFVRLGRVGVGRVRFASPSVRRSMIRRRLLVQRICVTVSTGLIWLQLKKIEMDHQTALPLTPPLRKLNNKFCVSDLCVHVSVCVCLCLFLCFSLLCSLLFCIEYVFACFVFIARTVCVLDIT